MRIGAAARGARHGLAVSIVHVGRISPGVRLLTLRASTRVLSATARKILEKVSLLGLLALSRGCIRA